MTGHSIGNEVHGNEVYLDKMENRDERPLVLGVCFSDESGIYFEGKMAARSEKDVFIRLEGRVEAPGPRQKELTLL